MLLDNTKLTNIKMKLAILIFITLIPLTVLQALNINSYYKMSIESELDSSQDYAEAYSSAFINYLENIWTTESAVGLSILSNPNWSENDIYNYMNKVIQSGAGVSEFSWVSPKGEVLISTNSLIQGRNLADRDYIRQIIGGSDKVLSDLRQSSDKNKIIIPIARGIRINGQLQGIVVSTLSEDEIKSISTAKRQGETSSYGLVDRNGMIVYRYGSGDIPFEKRKIKDNSPAWRALKGEIVKVNPYKSSIDGIERIGVNYPIKNIGWVCFVTITVEEQMKPYTANIKKSIAVLVLIYAVSFLLAIVFGRQFLNSISRIIRITKEIINGNLDAKTNLKGSDEIAVIGKAIDNMTEEVNRRINIIEEYNNLKAMFLATISHELKTPLNIILGCVQVIEKLNTEDAAHYINSVNKYNRILRQNSYRLLRLINNLIDVNKIEAHSIQINLKNGNIIKTVEDITLSIVEYTNTKDINLIFDTELEEKITAFDPDHMERIMLNILSNAIKFTQPGGTIEVNIYDKGQEIIISVKDSGIGIPPEKREKIFDRFTQVDNSFTRKSEGSGIGLSLVKSLVEMHGGKIWVESEVGRGSEFFIELPVRTVNIDEAVEYQDDISIERVHIEFSDVYM